MDIDLLGRTDNDVDTIVGLMREVALFEVADDGVVFEESSFAGGPIRRMPITRVSELRLIEGWMQLVSICKLILGLVTL